jgi:type IV secretory pathway VirB10-like protein
MREAVIRLTESANHAGEEESSPQTKVSLLTSAEKYLVDIQLFSRISGELTAFLSELSEKILSSAEQLKMIEQAVELKADELKRLHEINSATVALEQLMDAQKLEKEQFERFIANQRSLWEEEKSRRIQEYEQYMERLQVQRQHEEEEYRSRWAVEQEAAKQELAEELLEIRKKNEALGKTLLERELLLKEKELEWMQLVQELEQFMSKLGKRSFQPGF